jgi:hypothetical protein
MNHTEIAARQRGSLVIDRYEPRFNGHRIGGYAQERAWPRTGASTYYGEAIPPTEVPVPIINASYEAAFLELTNPSSLLPVVTAIEGLLWAFLTPIWPGALVV